MCVYVMLAPKKPVGAVSVLPIGGVPLIPTNGPAKSGKIQVIGPLKVLKSVLGPLIVLKSLIR